MKVNSVEDEFKTEFQWVQEELFDLIELPGKEIYYNEDGIPILCVNYSDDCKEITYDFLRNGKSYVVSDGNIAYAGKVSGYVLVNE